MPRRRKKRTLADLVVVEQSLRVLGKRITLQEAALLYEALGRHVPRPPVRRKRQKRQRKQKT